MSEIKLSYLILSYLIFIRFVRFIYIYIWSSNVAECSVMRVGFVNNLMATTVSSNLENARSRLIGR